MPIQITMPRLSDTMEQGTIIKWNVKEGDDVSAGDAIADVETDKATMEMQVFDDGTIGRIIVGEGQTVEVGTVIALLAEEGEDIAAVTSKAPPAAERTEATLEAPPDPETPAAPAAARSVAGDGRLRTSPLARRLAEEHGIDLAALEGSGTGGRVVKRDVLRAIETGVETAAAVAPGTPGLVRAPSAEPATPPAQTPLATVLEERLIPVSNIRQTIARRLVESKQTIPHYQVTASFTMDGLLGLRATLNEQLASQGVKLSVNDFILKACALAMHGHPEFNSSWKGDAIQVHGHVNVGLAIALPAERGGGLLVGTLRDTDRLTLRAISLESKRLAEKARTRGLSLEEMSDSTFVVSNLGMFGIEHFTAIINPPNTAILAVGAALEKPVVRDGELSVGHEMQVTLSLDHRVIDGAMGAQYLRTLGELLEHPATLLV